MDPDILADQSLPPLTDLPGFDDLLAEAMAYSSFCCRPSSLLKHRVMVSTEPAAAMVVTDANSGIVAISRGFSELCGFTLEEIQGRKPSSFLHGEKTQLEEVAKIRAALRANSGCVAELWNYHKCGTPYFVKIEIEPVFDASGVVEGYYALETKLASEAAA